MIGLDQVLGIIRALGAAYGTDKYRPGPAAASACAGGFVGKHGRVGDSLPMRNEGSMKQKSFSGDYRGDWQSC